MQNLVNEPKLDDMQKAVRIVPVNQNMADVCDTYMPLNFKRYT